MFRTCSRKREGLRRTGIMMLYRGMDRAALDAAYNNGAAVAATLAFIHGGYWQMNAKESFAFIAEGPLAHGINVAALGYTLAPDADIDRIVGEIRAATAWLAGNLARYG